MTQGNFTKTIFGFLILTILMEMASNSQINHSCQHPIFCNEKILTAISQSSLFQQDFKVFVDLVLKVPIVQALKSFQNDSLEDFIKNNFVSGDNILKPTSLPDYIQNPTHFQAISDKNLKQFAFDLNKRWNQLARKVDLNFTAQDNSCIQDCSSFIKVLDGRTLIIPGGRFAEGYYWDSYWIIKGLIASKMLESAENMVRNFLIILKEYGFIPNGFRQYYLNRSQPPFFTLMVKDVTEALYLSGKKDRAQQLEKDSFMLLVGQHNFWQSEKQKTIVLKNQHFKVNYYNANTTTPRYQSYRQDLKQLSSIKDQTQRKSIFHQISSMAESGWDFSSRWFKKPTDILTTSMDEIIPSDLNTILALNQEFLAKLSSKFQRQDLQKYFMECLKQRKTYFSLIKTSDGRYPDLRPYENNNIYPSDYYPCLLFSQQPDVSSIYNDVVNPVSSKTNNQQQWDQPNVWAPNNWILHEVLPHKQGFQFAQQWISTVYCSWKKDGLIYQKYRNDKLGVRGQGGEYQVQTGFGWTNGLALYYLTLYPKELVAPNLNDCAY